MSVNDSVYSSASYAPCPTCNEGALVWDTDRRTSHCAVCGADSG